MKPQNTQKTMYKRLDKVIKTDSSASEQQTGFKLQLTMESSYYSQREFGINHWNNQYNTPKMEDAVRNNGSFCLMLAGYCIFIDYLLVSCD